MAAFALLLAAAALSYVAVAYVKRWALAHQIMDIPNARSSHTRPMPRAGGIGIVLTFSAAFLAASAISGGLPPMLWGVLVGGLAVAAVGLIDDLRRLPARYRFAVHLGAAIGAVAAGVRLDTLEVLPFGSLSLGVVGVGLSVLWLVGVTNIYNFMDGIDGIAAGEAVLVGVGLVVLGAIHADLTVTLVAGGLAGSALGFLLHNFPPARVFMGDVGSGFLGFVLAGLVLVLSGSGGQAEAGTAPALAGAILLAPFLLDSSLTLVRRVVKGERWYEAHRSHYYQRLVIAGYSHRAVSLLYYGLTCLTVLGAVTYVWSSSAAGLVIALASVLPFFGLLILVRRLESGPPRTASSHG